MGWGSSQWAGWGMPFGIGLFPIFFLICMGFMFFFFIRGRGSLGCHSRGVDSDVMNRELLEEVRKLRQEVEELKRAQK